MRNKIQILNNFNINMLATIVLLEFFIFNLSAAVNPLSNSYQKDNACTENMFLCSSTQRCIPRSWLCDQERDCLEGEDEKDCDNQQTKCAKNEYACHVTNHGVSKVQENPWLMHLTGVGSIFSHTCIPLKWKCDGEIDCLEKDDEEYCQEIKCDEKHFQCKSFDSSTASCIPIEWVCDGQMDCLNMEDEKNCTAVDMNNKCDSSEFRCDDGQCIHMRWRCDGDNDCADGSDEKDCKNQACDGKFKCKSTNICIPSEWHCDGELDCPDHSDEIDCDSNHLSLHSVNCSSLEFKCKNHAQCISKFWICDGDEDCFDGSDETNCTKDQCTDDQKACDDGRCIDRNFWCDGVENCLDHSDERNCTNVAVIPKIENCDSSEYTCPNDTPRRCIKYEHLCDGTANDCIPSVCNNDILNCAEKDNKACACRQMGPNKDKKLCHCKLGYEVRGPLCQDIDECLQPGICSQKCINLPGTYRCECYPGYILSSEKGRNVPHKCRAVGSDPILLLANRATIRQYDIVTNKYHPLINQLESAVALDYWHENQTLIWSDVSKEQIMICSGVTGLKNGTMLESIDKNCTDDKHNLIKISENVTTPDGLALDWVHGLLFWTDTGTDTINVYDFNTKRRTVLIDTGLDEPRAIVVDPIAGLLFWTDWGQNARIERSGMDGKDRMVIIEGNSIRWPNGLAIDILDKRLYWADAKTKRISSSDYWGRNIRVILASHQHLRHPFSLAVFEERLYWTDWDQECVLSVNKFNGGNISKLMNGIAGPMTVRVYHQQAQPRHENKCKNHNCNHICLPKALYKNRIESNEHELIDLPYSCACENGFQVDINNSSLCFQNPISAMSAVVVQSIEHINHDRTNPTAYVFGLFLVCSVFVGIYIYQRRRPRHFAAIHFDNPIYRRTVEPDLDADLENLPDNSLGPITILGIGPNQSDGSSNGQNLFEASTFPLQSTKLVLAVPMQRKDDDTSSTSIMVDTTNLEEYAYDQPQTPKS